MTIDVKSLNARAEENKQKRIKSNQDMNKLLIAFDIVFNSPNGVKVLEYLKSNTVDKPTWNPAVGASGDQCVYTAFIREGQNSLYREIKRLVDSGAAFRESGNYKPEEDYYD